jgi:hypothetical protein
MKNQIRSTLRVEARLQCDPRTNPEQELAQIKSILIPRRTKQEHTESRSIVVSNI